MTRCQRSPGLGVILLVVGLAAASFDCRGTGTRAETEALLRKRSEQIVAAEASKNIDSVLTFYAKDAVIHPPGAPAAQGHPEIRRLYQDFYRTVPFSSFTATIRRLEVSPDGSLAFETGVNRFLFEHGGATTEDLGKYLTVWRKEDDEWKIAAVAFSSDHP